MSTFPWTNEELAAAITAMEEAGPSEQDGGSWAVLRDYEKREVAFEAGARWAAEMMAKTSTNTKREG